MGLDMYLNKRIYLGANYEHNKVTGTIDLHDSSGPVKVDLKKVTYIIEEVGYWRKANAVHQWFVENVQNNKDDCNEHDVDYEKLLELRDLCKRLLANQSVDASLELPTQEGFFFGSTEYGDLYKMHLEDTVKIIDSLEPNGHYTYRSSW